MESAALAWVLLAVIFYGFTLKRMSSSICNTIYDEDQTNEESDEECYLIYVARGLGYYLQLVHAALLLFLLLFLPHAAGVTPCTDRQQM